MAEFYHATIKYSTGQEVETVHKGETVHPATVKMLARMGATISLGDRLPPEKEREYEALSVAARRPKRYTGRPRIDKPTGGDNGHNR